MERADFDSMQESLVLMVRNLNDAEKGMNAIENNLEWLVQKQKQLVLEQEQLAQKQKQLVLEQEQLAQKQKKIVREQEQLVREHRESKEEVSYVKEELEVILKQLQGVVQDADASETEESN